MDDEFLAGNKKLKYVQALQDALQQQAELQHLRAAASGAPTPVTYAQVAGGTSYLKQTQQPMRGQQLFQQPLQAMGGQQLFKYMPGFSGN